MAEPIARRAPTIYDVAKLAGVSHQTVSRFIKGHRVSELTQLKVQESITRLGFVPNAAARSLATRRSHRIGALVYEMTQIGPMTILTSAANAARQAGYVLDIVALDPFDTRSTLEAIALINQHDLAGVLAFVPNDSILAQLHETDFRVPAFFETQVDSAATVESSNLNLHVGSLAANHLLELGHARIAHIAGPSDWPAARLRTRGFTERLAHADKAPLVTVRGDWSARSGFEAMTSILATHPEVTAVFSSNDQMAMGAMSAAAHSGLRIPQDLSVVGIDDAPEAAFTIPALTTIPMHFAEQGQFAFEALLALISGAPIPLNLRPNSTVVLARESSAPPKIS